jgi:hypothetical protein
VIYLFFGNVSGGEVGQLNNGSAHRLIGSELSCLQH